ncbi:MAG: hypothetical protein Q8K86_07785 [Candidatus Nanopelagicaceae bacterium]|nr:hypothetical protein [Candidatus Nanopelagicaceae bacterium]
MAARRLSNTLHHDLDVTTATAPRWLSALTTCCSAAHFLTVPYLFHWLWTSIFFNCFFTYLTAATVLLWYAPQRVFDMIAAP